MRRGPGVGKWMKWTILDRKHLSHVVEVLLLILLMEELPVLVAEHLLSLSLSGVHIIV